MCLAERRVVLLRDVRVDSVCEVLAVDRYEHSRQQQREHGEHEQERNAVRGDPIKRTIEQRWARLVSSQVRVLEDVREHREKRTAAEVGLDLVAKVCVQLHVGVEVGLRTLGPQSLLLSAFLVLEVECF